MRRKGIFVTGVGTGIGKTAVAGAVAHLLKGKGYDVGVMKPVQTGTKPVKGRPVSPDYEFMKSMAGSNDPYELGVPYSFKEPLSPYHAAKAENRKINISSIAQNFEKLCDLHDVVIVEGAGGLMVPLTARTFWPDLVKMLGIPVLIVTHPELGMIHQTISTVLSAELNGLEVCGMVISETSRKHPDPDTEWLERSTGVKILGLLPYTSSISGNINKRAFQSHVDKHLDPNRFAGLVENRAAAKRTEQLVSKDREFVWHPFTQMKEWIDEDLVVIESACGVKLKDTLGREYYDGHSSYWVNVHGHGNPALVRRLAKESAKLDHSTFLGLANRNALELAEKLVEITPENLQKVFFSDNGSTAVEAGMKMAVQYFRQRPNPNPGKTKFIALGDAYHGDTLGAVAVGGVDIYRRIFGPLLADVTFAPSPNCYRCPLKREREDCSLACAVEMERIIEENANETAAFVIEPIVQCPGGIIIAPHGYLSRVREACTKHDVLMIADEVAVGFGRTGRMFACEHEEVLPDIMALSKGIAAGLIPLAATLATNEIFDAFLGDYEERKTFFHGHTFTAHSPACGVALESLKLYKERKVIESLEAKGQFLSDLLVRFENLPHVGDVRQKGMVVGIELVKDRETKGMFPVTDRVGQSVIMEARNRGLIIRPLGDVIVLFPILGASGNDIKNMTDILYDSIAVVTGGFEKNLP